MKLFHLILLISTLAVPTIAQTPARSPAKPMTAEEQQFELKIRPLLHDSCLSCHGSVSPMRGLRLDSRAAALKGGESGPGLKPGDPEHSLLIQAIEYDGKLKMPPSGKLKPDQIAVLKEWVKNGAIWPESLKKTPAAAPLWSLHPVRKPSAPIVKAKSRVKNPIDAFILAKLEIKNLSYAPPADRRILLRRVTFDLTGLPPTPQELKQFLGDKRPDAYARMVDRLLKSPHYGERWARHWMDIARYADTKGYSFVSDPNFHHAYTYRDWLIRAFNEDMPYDQFVLQQLAGDQLRNGDDWRPLAAMGFLTLGRRFLNDPALINDDRIDTTMRGLQGLTVACARCHDHKFDPITQKDYYALYGVFASSNEPDPPLPISEKAIREPYQRWIETKQKLVGDRDALLRTEMTGLRSRMSAGTTKLPADANKTLQAIREEVLPDEAQQRQLIPFFTPEAGKKLPEIRMALNDLEKNKPRTPEFALAMVDGPPVEQHVFIRGNSGNLGDVVPRRFLTVLSGDNPKPFQQGSGRLELAKRIASPNNPLTARVIINRIWLQHFGEGLVRTPNDFGSRGEPPTHPELLDWLAATLLEDAGGRSGSSATGKPWSLKKIQRLILLSDAYQQSVRNEPRAVRIDPENRLLWSQRRQRFDLETLRDSLLAVSGQLDPAMGGPSVELTTAPFAHRRAVYGFIERQNLPGLFRTFDFASPDSSSGKRFQTTVPQQALFMMNSPFVAEQARALSARVKQELQGSATTDARISRLYSLLYNRAPDPEELRLGRAFLKLPSSKAAPLSAWQYGYGRIEEATGKVQEFTRFAFYSGDGWRVSDKFPDPKLGYLILTALGGHPGSDAEHAVIRRWVAPVDGVVDIEANLAHDSAMGDGVRGRIVSSRTGILSTWEVFHGVRKTDLADVPVRKGDTLDFVTDCKTGPAYDAFSWAPVIRMSRAGKIQTIANNEARAAGPWNAASDFGGPEKQQPRYQDNWERYIQALLMTNEFTFID